MTLPPGMITPPVPYFGGKITLAPKIVSLFPGHEHYVEPYCGSLAVLLAKPPSPMETVNDLDSDLMLFWRVLRDHPDDLARVCALTPHSREEFTLSADRPPGLPDLERARRVWVKLTQGRSGLLTRTGWRYYVGPDDSLTKRLDGYVNRLTAVTRRLHHVTLENRPALEIIERYGAHPDVLLYVDPPYLGSTRTAANGYRHEMLSDDAHRELAAALRACRASVVLSGYPSPLYDELYTSWHHQEIPASTRQGTGPANRTEVLWSNRPLGSQPDLFDTDLFDTEPTQNGAPGP